MTYPRAVALAEGSWTQIDDLTNYVTAIYGDQGTLLVEPRSGGRLWHATREHPEGQEVEVPPPAPSWQSASRHFVTCLATGDAFAPLCDARHGRDIQEVLQAALQSATTGTEVSVPVRC